MTSRTNRHSGGRNQGDPGEVAPSDLEQRRQLAVERYLAGDPIAVICQEMGCAKSWLYKWKHRYQAAEPAWFTALQRDIHGSFKDIVRLRHTLSPDGLGTVSAGVIRDHLRQHRVESIPSCRTIYRILNRQTQEGASQSVQS